MLTDNGEALLQAYKERTFEKKCVKAAENVYYFQCYGHSNATLIIGEDGCILVDVLDTDLRAERMKAEIAAITEKPVTTLIYTHGHPDHTGGAAAFADTVTEIIAHAPMRPVLGRSRVVAGELMKRGTRQFGMVLSDEELITQGLGPRQGNVCNDGVIRVLPPTTILTGETVTERTIHGVPLKLIPAVGETDDQMYVWLPEQKVLCCGDNFYPCFPNLYALRGSQYRDVAAWVDSLALIPDYPVEVLLPGHGYAISGADAVQQTIGTYRGALEYVLEETLQGMARGETMDEIAASVRLPEEYRNSKILGEHYGCVEWSVRSIFMGYAGWFDGNPTNMHPLSPSEAGAELIALAGGVEATKKRIAEAMEAGKYQWAMQLCDALLGAEAADGEAKVAKAECCRKLAEQETSCNGRHFYLTCAKELLGEIRL